MSRVYHSPRGRARDGARIDRYRAQLAALKARGEDLADYDTLTFADGQPSLLVERAEFKSKPIR